MLNFAMEIMHRMLYNIINGKNLGGVSVWGFLKIWSKIYLLMS
jgi:hypothetical protein